jgi:hypothetical protein
MFHVGCWLLQFFFTFLHNSDDDKPLLLLLLSSPYFEVVMSAFHDRMNKDDSAGGDDFAFLRRAAATDRVDTADIDQLVEDIGGVLQRCRVDESTVSDEERHENEELIRCVARVFNAIHDRCETGAIVLLFMKRISTPTNLEALLRMMDADIRTGGVRCVANNLMSILATMSFVLGLKMNGGSSLASCLVSCCSKSLEDDADQSKQIPHITGCCCWAAGKMLKTALLTAKEDPLKVLDRVAGFDWKTILETYPSVEFSNESFLHQLFSMLWDLAVNVLLLDRSNSKAKSFLRKLGSCHELFRSSLRRLVALRSLPSSPGNMTTTTLTYLMALSLFHESFHYCLVPPPSDPEIEVLVSLANHSLKEVRPTVFAAIQFDDDSEASCITNDQYDRLIEYTQADEWTHVKHLSDDDRWRSLETAVLSPLQARDVKKTLKTMRQSKKKDMKSDVEALHGFDEACNNCFRLESGLEEGKKLMICGWCKQVSYCSRECQMEHWKKFHKKECTGGGKGKSKKKSSRDK